jgi:hypothetical protein
MLDILFQLCYCPSYQKEQAMNELDKNGKPITDCAQETLQDAGGIPVEYRSRVSVLRASTGDENRSNMVIDIGLDGTYIGTVLGLFAGHSNLPLVLFHVNTEWSAIHKGKIWGRELEIYGSDIIVKDIREMVELYITHKNQIDRMNFNLSQRE